MSTQYDTQQMTLFDATLDAYARGHQDNADVYQDVTNALNIANPDETKVFGRESTPRNKLHHRIRWAQQGLKQAGYIENIGRGLWQITKEGKQTLTRINVDRYMIAASTDLGVAIWGNSEHVFKRVINDDIHLCVTSPPYLGIERSYGTHKSETAYIDFILRILTPIRERMAPGANLALNLSNDTVIRGAFGEHSLYLEKLTLRLAEELGLALMDRPVWHAADKPPRSYQVTHKRTHLVSRYEPLLWFCNEPQFCLANNRRVLDAYSDYMKRIISQGGEQRQTKDKDYVPVGRSGGFSKDNGGSIPGNVLSFPTCCASNREVLGYADQLNLPNHGALYPVSLASFLINWLCPEGGLVVDPFGGYSTTGYAAEMSNRRWLTCELHWEYIKPALLRFKEKQGYYVNPLFDSITPLSLAKYAA